MNVWAILPVKVPESGKTRLSSRLSTQERAQLNLLLFRRTLRVVTTVISSDRTVVVSASTEILSMASSLCAVALKESGTGLNPALHQASTLAAGLGAQCVAAFTCDLPLMEPDDVQSLIDGVPAGGGGAIAPDHFGTGTNALALSPAGVLPYRFGSDSFAAHTDAARSLSVNLHKVMRPGLACDLDLPADLNLLRNWRALA